MFNRLKKAFLSKSEPTPEEERPKAGEKGFQSITQGTLAVMNKIARPERGGLHHSLEHAEQGMPVPTQTIKYPTDAVGNAPAKRVGSRPYHGAVTRADTLRPSLEEKRREAQRMASQLEGHTNDAMVSTANHLAASSGKNTQMTAEHPPEELIEKKRTQAAQKGRLLPHYEPTMREKLNDLAILLDGNTGVMTDPKGKRSNPYRLSSHDHTLSLERVPLPPPPTKSSLARKTHGLAKTEGVKRKRVRFAHDTKPLLAHVGSSSPMSVQSTSPYDNIKEQ